MAEETKFSKEELEQVKGIQQDYRNVQDNFGQVSMARLRLEEQMNMLDINEDELRNKFTELQDKEKNFLDGVTEKYGDGTLNPETGIFTSNKS